MALRRSWKNCVAVGVLAGVASTALYMAAVVFWLGDPFTWGAAAAFFVVMFAAHLVAERFAGDRRGRKRAR